MPRYIDADALSAKIKAYFGTQNGKMPSTAEVAILSAIDEAPSVERHDKWTGLTDKNGKDIFEGDLIQGKSKRIFKIKYINDIAGYSALPTDERSLAYPGMNVGTMQCYEVIGNIHDNADLLRTTGEDIGDAAADTLRPATQIIILPDIISSRKTTLDSGLPFASLTPINKKRMVGTAMSLPKK